jgi:hypothetical protein
LTRSGVSCAAQLDAHTGTDPKKWPLPTEIAVIVRAWSEGYILIDDFVVPDRPEYGSDAAHYNMQVVFCECVSVSVCVCV